MCNALMWKNSIFEMLIIPQTLNINNLRTTSAKSISLHAIRKLVEFFLKNVAVKTMFTLTVVEMLLFEDRSVLSNSQWSTGSKSFSEKLKKYLDFVEIT